MSDVEAALKLIKDNDVQYVDFRFTDPRGKWQHTAQHVSTIDEDTFKDGIMFDGSSIAGWKAINESDMTLMPDASTAVMDPFAEQSSMILFCSIIEPSTGQPYTRDPRSAAQKAEAHLKATGIGDTAYIGPEAEFFVFDDARFQVSQNHTFYALDSLEGRRTTWAPKSSPATPATGRGKKAAISRCRRSTAARICARKWSRSWPTWASRWKSTITRWRPRSMSSA